MNIEDIIIKYERFIKSEIYNYDKDDYVVDEVYQKVIIKLWQKPPEKINLKYLSKLVKYTFIDNYRRNKKVIKTLPIDHFDFVSDYNTDYLIDNKESEIESILFMQSLLCKIDKLKQSQRDIVLLKLKGYNFIEIAKIMNITQNNAIGQMHYAKKNIKKNDTN